MSTDAVDPTFVGVGGGGCIPKKNFKLILNNFECNKNNLVPSFTLFFRVGFWLGNYLPRRYL